MKGAVQGRLGKASFAEVERRSALNHLHTRALLLICMQANMPIVNVMHEGFGNGSTKTLSCKRYYRARSDRGVRATATLADMGSKFIWAWFPKIMLAIS
jgi:hypothetical protein